MKAPANDVITLARYQRVLCETTLIIIIIIIRKSNDLKLMMQHGGLRAFVLISLIITNPAHKPGDKTNVNVSFYEST